MPQIPVNLGDIEANDNLPVGTYLGIVDKAVYAEAREEGKFPQIRVTYTVNDGGEHQGRKSTEFLSLSPKALWRLKRFFMKFGLGDEEALDVDDGTNDLLNPDIVGFNVIFKCSKDGEWDRTELVSVEDDPAPVSTPAPAPAPKAAEATETPESAPAAEPATAAPRRPQRRTLR